MPRTRALFLPDKEVDMFKHILIPTDGSLLSRKAIAEGVKLARSLGARVTGLFAAPQAATLPLIRPFLE